jgi:NAD(P)-dependent dehydrogenase (short-subunit alcohol dehydrogenase family)
MTSEFDLKGRVAIVTGGSGIIGSRLCHGLADSGAKVAVVDIDEDRASELAGEIRSTHATEAIAIRCDVSSPESVADMVIKTTETLGDIRILMNNAARKPDDLSAFFAEFEEYDLAVWRDIMSVNLDGVFLVAQAVGRAMRAHGHPSSIIQTSSIYGLMAPDNRIYDGSEYMGVKINTPAVYAASKAAVVGLTRYLSTYWAEHGIRVNAIAPGGVESGQNDAFKSNYSARIPLGRMADADEMVGAVVFLASDASSYITGQVLAVDGGLSAW